MPLADASSPADASAMHTSGREAGKGALFVVLATPDAILSIESSGVSARLLHRADGAVGASLRLPPLAPTTALAGRCEEEFGLTGAQGFVDPVLIAENGDLGQTHGRPR